MKAPGNAISPCRFCRVEGTWASSSRHFYYPHNDLQKAGMLDLRLDLRTEINDAIEAGEATCKLHGIDITSS